MRSYLLSSPKLRMSGPLGKLSLQSCPVSAASSWIITPSPSVYSSDYAAAAAACCLILNISITICGVKYSLLIFLWCLAA